MSTYLAHRPGAAPIRDMLFIDWPAFTAPPGDREHRPACAGVERMGTTDAKEARELADEYCVACPVLAACNDEAKAMAADHRWCQSPEGVWAGQLWIGGKPAKKPRKPRKYKVRAVSCGHPEERHYAHGLCEPCYIKTVRKKHIGECVTCGLERPIYAKGRCGACYMRIHRMAS